MPADNKVNEEYGELRRVANRLFSSEDGKIYANQMFKDCRLFESDKSLMTDAELRRISSFQDFVNVFITRLVDRDVLMGIFEYHGKDK